GIKVSVPVANCIFRLYQEAFTNITRYAHANEVLVAIQVPDGKIMAVVKDDGTGFNVASVQNNKSFGILGMKERVLSLGGQFELISEPGKGTKITVELPYDLSN
ncbi:MAG: ATP-binding protein, partial [Bacteroidota bacterium]|nr:ATP-binding protein [Bacteroidota bacterium]